MKKGFICCFLFLIMQLLPGGISLASTFEDELKGKTGITRVRQLLNCMRYGGEDDPVKISGYIKEAFDYGAKHKSEEATIIGHFILGYYFSQTGMAQEAIPELKKALKYYTRVKDAKKLLHCHYRLAGNYQVLGKKELAGYHYKQTLRYCRRPDQIETYNQVRGNILKLSSHQDPKKAISYYKAQLPAEKAKEEPSSIAGHIYRNLAYQYSLLNKIDSVSYYANLALNFYQKTGDPAGKDQSLNYLAEVNLELGNYAKAEEQILAAIAISKKFKFQASLCNDYITLSKLYRGKKQYNLAKQWLDSASVIAAKTPTTFSSSTILEEKITLAESNNNFETASQLYKELIALNDSITKAETKSKVIALETKYRMREYQAELKTLKNKHAISQLETRLVFIVSAALLSVLGLTTAFSIRHRKRDKIFAEKEKQTISTHLENEQLKNSRIAEELAFKKRQLTSQTLHLSEKSQLLQTLDEIADFTDNETETLLKQKLKKLRQTIRANNQVEKDWIEFKTSFDELHEGFFNQLKEKFPDLSPNELRLAAFIKLRLSIRECANILRVEANTVKTSRYRLKKKLGLETEASLEDFIAAI